MVAVRDRSPDLALRMKSGTCFHRVGHLKVLEHIRPHTRTGNLYKYDVRTDIDEQLIRRPNKVGHPIARWPSVLRYL